MNIFLPIHFLQREIILCFLDTLQGQQMRQITYGVFLFMVSFKAFKALIFRSFDLHDALQHVDIVFQLVRYSCYSRYRGVLVL